MSIDPYGKFGPMGKYGPYGRIGSVVNVVGASVILIGGTTMSIVGHAPWFFTLLFAVVGVFLVWRFTKIAQAARRREREEQDAGSSS
jgi:threonine/homoserine/homoserine lactone efflux protein